MPDYLEMLADLGGPAIGPQIQFAHNAHLFGEWQALGHELLELLTIKNGLFAYESALLVRPLRAHGDVLGISEWNSQDLWKADYNVDLSHTLHFAEDLVGGQYCLHGGEVCYFDPETGNRVPVAASMRGWSKLIVTQSALRTMNTLAHDWQLKNGAIPPGKRLLPVPPFVAGGKYDADHLFLTPDVDAMRFRAALARQIRNLPDGAQVTIQVDWPHGRGGQDK